MTKKSQYSGEKSLILDSTFLDIYPINLSMDDRDTMERLIRHYYDQLVGPDNSRIPIEECENGRLFGTAQNLYAEAQRRLEQYKNKKDLVKALSTWRTLKLEDREIIQRIAERKNNGGDKSSLFERLCIQLEHLPERIYIKGKSYPYPLLLLYQQL